MPMGSKRRSLRLLIVAAVISAPLAFPAPAHATLSGRTFQTPSGNVGCGFYAGVLRCDILSGLNPEPQGNCDLDWTGLALEANGDSAPVCAGDTVYNPDAPVLGYGSKWKRKGIVCTSRKTGLKCRNQRSHGFFLSRNSWDTF